MARIYLNERIWRDPETKNYILLDISDEIGEQQAEIVDGVELLPKNEYHITLVPAGKLSDNHEIVEVIIDDIDKFLNNNPDAITFEGLGPERYVCRDGDEMTLIARATITGQDSLRRIIQRHIPGYRPAFPHVTLLKSASSPYGIGINSLEEFGRLCRPL